MSRSPPKASVIARSDPRATKQSRGIGTISPSVILANARLAEAFGVARAGIQTRINLDSRFHGNDIRV